MEGEAKNKTKMINYLEKYNQLPKEIRDKVSSRQVMDAIHKLEDAYKVNLASLVMRVIVGDLKIDDLHAFFIYKYSFDDAKAKQIVMELDTMIFSRISNYLTYINSGRKETETEHTEGSGIAKGGADFYFSIEDEEEVRQKAKDLQGLDNRERIAKQVEMKIDDVMSKINVIFSSEDMVNRLRQILKTYLRGVRNMIDTKLVLEREIKNGGLGLDAEIADDILKVVNAIKKDEAEHPERFFKPRKFVVPEDKSKEPGDKKNASVSGDAVYDFSQLKKKDNNKQIAEDKTSDKEPKQKEGEPQTKKEQTDGPAIKEAKDKEEQNDQSEEKNKKDSKELVLDLKKPETGTNETVTDEQEKENEQKTARAQKPDTVRFKKPISKPLPARDSGKVRMDDIKRVSRQGGPIGEVANMRLVDFRRLDDNPEIAAEKVLEILKLLEEESFAKKMEGVKAWRTSPLNKLYLSIGQESLISKKNIKEFIKSKKTENQESITEEEFNAIMSLNKKLRY